MRRRLQVALAVATAIIVGAGVAYALTVEDHSTWLDQPLDGSSHDGPVILMAHADSAGAIAEIGFEVDGVEVARQQVSGSGLAMVEDQWAPTKSGVALVAAFSVADDGSTVYSDPVMILVDAQLDPETTTTTGAPTTTTTGRQSPTTTPPNTTPTATTLPPTSTTTPTTTPPTSTTTTIACTPSIPRITAPFGTITDTSPEVTWLYSGCEPASFDIEISADSDFTDVEQSGSVGSGARSWVTGDLEICRRYWVRVRGASVSAIGAWSPEIMFDLAGRTCP